MGDGKKLKEILLNKSARLQKQLVSVPQHFIQLFKRILISDLTLHLDWQMN